LCHIICYTPGRVLCYTFGTKKIQERPISQGLLSGKTYLQHSIYTNTWLSGSCSLLLNGGFCPGKSTVTAFVPTFHNILQLMENGLDVSLVFINLCKAFDSRVPHLPLLQKHGLNQQWIALYLSNTAICCGGWLFIWYHFCGGWLFIWYHFCGVWHSTEFSSEAFTVYVNNVSSLTLMVQADNVCGTSSSTNQSSALRIIVVSKQRLMPYRVPLYSSSYLTLNPCKCKYLICSRERHPHLPPTGLLLAGITG